MQNEFRGDTLADVLDQLTWDIETKRSRQQLRVGRNRCEAQMRNIVSILSKMEQITSQIASVSNSTKREIERAQRATRDARIGIVIDLAPLLIGIGSIAWGARGLKVAIGRANRAARRTATIGGAFTAFFEVRSFLSEVDTISGRLAKIKQNRDLVAAGRRLSILKRNLQQINDQYERALQKYNTSEC